MEDDGRFDSLVMNLTNQCQGVQNLLHATFGFLRRNSDFFTGASQSQVEDLVLEIVRKQAKLSERDEAEKKRKAQKEAEKKAQLLEEKKKRDLEAAVKAATAAAAAAKTVPPPAPADEEDDVLELSPDGTFDASAPKKKAPVLIPKAVIDTDEKNDPNSEPTKPVVTQPNDEEEEEDNSPPPVNNGGKTDKYVWSQTLAELTVNIPLPAGIKAKMLDVDIQNKKLKVAIKGQEPIVLGELNKRIVVDDSFWTVEDNELVISFSKENKMEWWPSVILGDAEINTKKIVPENSKLADLDGETRKTVEKMMFDQKQKALGLPSSDELQKQEMLKKFMEAHPEMDFSNAKMM